MKLIWEHSFYRFLWIYITCSRVFNFYTELHKLTFAAGL